MTRRGPARGARPVTALQVLEQMAKQQAAAGARQLAATFGVSPAKIHSVLKRLVEDSFVVQDAQDRAYRLGPRTVRLARLVAQDMPLERVARPIMQDLACESGETVMLNAYVAHDQTALVVAIEEGNGPLQYVAHPGEAGFLHAGAGSKSILAFLPAPEIETAVARHGLPPVTGRTVVDRGQLDRDLALIRQHGVAVSCGERVPGAVGIAAPVFGAGHRVLGSLTIIVPQDCVSAGATARLSRAVKRQAARVSEVMGCEMPAPARARRRA